jgi:lipopolysaccharide export system permease protein
MIQVDRYILFLYLRVLIVCFACLAGLMIIIHAFSNLDELVTYGKKRGSMAQGLFEYYGPYSLVLLDRFGGMLALLATLFVVSWLKRTNEIIVMMAAGVSPKRILAMPMLGSILFFVFLAVNREVIIPRFEETLGKNPQDLSEEHLRQVRPVFDGKYGMLVGGKLLSLGAREIKQPNFRLEGPAAVVGTQIQSHTAKYLDATNDHPTGFLISELLLPTDLFSKPSVFHDSQPVLLTPVDQKWLPPGSVFLACSIEFEELLGGSTWMQYASTAAMIQRLRSPNSIVNDELRLTVHQRFVQPMLELTLLLLGIPILLKNQDRNLFWITGITVLSIGVFMLVIKVFQSMASGATPLSPYLGAWLPLIIIAPIAYARAQKAWLR